MFGELNDYRGCPCLSFPVVLKAAKAKKPALRYQAGGDAKRLFEARRKINDVEFEKFLYELFGL